MKKNIVFLVSLFFAFSIFNAPLRADKKTPEPPAPLPNFGQVNDNISRSGQPTQEGIQLLHERGVKVVVNLFPDKDWINRERLWVEKNDMRYISLPWSPFDWPDSERVQKFLEIANDPNNFPMHVHDDKGSASVGAAIGVYRFKHDHWKFEQIYSEMVRFGFDEAWFGHLREYVKEFTEYRNRPDETLSLGWLLEDVKSEILAVIYSLRKLVA